MFDTIINHPLWGASILGNTLFDYALMFLSFLFLTFAFEIIKGFAVGHFRNFAARSDADLPRVATKVAESVRASYIAFLAVYIASLELTLAPFFEKLFLVALILWTAHQVICSLLILADYGVAKRTGSEAEKGGSAIAIRMVRFGIKFLIGAVAFIMALSSVEVDVTSLVAGLGLSGIAIAFAAQNILADLFSSLSIYLDKPFGVGDTISIGSDSGTVEKIGLKTTRLRTPRGEELVVSNRELTTVRVLNLKKMTERRVVFPLGIVHDTEHKKLEEIPEWIKEIVTSVPGVRFERIHLKDIAPSSLQFEVSYVLASPEHSAYLGAQNAINFAIHKKFSKEKVKLA